MAGFDAAIDQLGNTLHLIAQCPEVARTDR
jgi:hypothetical protein